MSERDPNDVAIGSDWQWFGHNSRAIRFSAMSPEEQAAWRKQQVDTIRRLSKALSETSRLDPAVTLTRDEVSQLMPVERLAARNKQVLFNVGHYFRSNKTADVAIGLMVLISILADDERYGYRCTLSVPRTAAFLGRSERAIRDARRRLKTQGLIVTEDINAFTCAVEPALMRVIASEDTSAVWIVDAAAPPKDAPNHRPRRYSAAGASSPMPSEPPEGGLQGVTPKPTEPPEATLQGDNEPPEGRLQGDTGTPGRQPSPNNAVVEEAEAKEGYAPVPGSGCKPSFSATNPKDLDGATLHHGAYPQEVLTGSSPLRGSDRIAEPQWRQEESEEGKSSEEQCSEVQSPPHCATPSRQPAEYYNPERISQDLGSRVEIISPALPAAFGDEVFEWVGFEQGDLEVWREWASWVVDASTKVAVRGDLVSAQRARSILKRSLVAAGMQGQPLDLVSRAVAKAFNATDAVVRAGSLKGGKPTAYFEATLKKVLIEFQDEREEQDARRAYTGKLAAAEAATKERVIVAKGEAEIAKAEADKAIAAKRPEAFDKAVERRATQSDKIADAKAQRASGPSRRQGGSADLVPGTTVLMSAFDRAAQPYLGDKLERDEALTAFQSLFSRMSKTSDGYQQKVDPEACIKRLREEMSVRVFGDAIAQLKGRAVAMLDAGAVNERPAASKWFAVPQELIDQIASASPEADRVKHSVELIHFANKFAGWIGHAQITGAGMAGMAYLNQLANNPAFIAAQKLDVTTYGLGLQEAAEAALRALLLDQVEALMSSAAKAVDQPIHRHTHSKAPWDLRQKGF